MFTILIVILTYFCICSNDEVSDSLMASSPHASNNAQKKVSHMDTPKLQVEELDALDDYIEKCKEIAKETGEVSDDEINEVIQKTDKSDYFKALNDSSINIEDRLSILIELYLNQGDDLAALDVSRICATHDAPANCNSEFIDKFALKSDSNAEKWLNIANYYAKNGDKERVLTNIKKVLEANYYGNMYVDTVIRISEEIDTKTDVGLYNSLLIGIGVQASNSASYGPIFEFCKGSANDIYTSSLCFQLGQDFLRGKTKMLYMYGLGLMRMMVEVSEFESEQHINPMDYQSLESFNDENNFGKVSELMKYNDNLILSWLGYLKEYGEMRASIESVKEAMELVESHDYTHCSK